jgi:malic enzyme
MQLTIRVAQQVAPSLARGEAVNPQARELLRLGQELGIRFRPLHPGAEDPRLASYFVVEVADAAAARNVAARLRDCEAVEAAYQKPPDEPP